MMGIEMGRGVRSASLHHSIENFVKKSSAAIIETLDLTGTNPKETNTKNEEISRGVNQGKAAEIVFVNYLTSFLPGSD